jgi:hypothetical protein
MGAKQTKVSGARSGYRFSSNVVLIGSACLLAGVIAGWSVRDGVSRVFDAFVTPGWERYSDDMVTFLHPSSAEQVTAEDPYMKLGDEIVAFKNDEQSYKAPNFSQDTWFVVSSETLDEDHCYVEEQYSFTHEQLIGGVSFHVATRSEAGAGNRYEATLYRTYQDGVCYEVATTLHYASDFTDIDQDAMDASLAAARLDLEKSVDSFRLK